MVFYVCFSFADKPAAEDLQYFLEFQVPQQWAPMFNDLALGLHRKKVSFPQLQFRFLGPKLHVNTTQVNNVSLCMINRENYFSLLH